MYDLYNRRINYLRISVTDRCNLRCQYCMPEEGVRLLPHKEILTYEEIVEIVKTGLELGITKVRITGGEPLVRKGIVSLIEQLSQLPKIEDLCLTTNAQLLAEMARDLKRAGLDRVNVSLDTLDEKKYFDITRGGSLTKALDGIMAAMAAGLQPVKINCVVENSANEEDAIGVKQWALARDLQVRYIHRMTLEKGHFSIVEGGDGGNCVQCNRLRLTANGMLKPCLFSNLSFDTRLMGIRQAFEAAVNAKPGCGTVNSKNQFYNIGG